MSTNLDHKQYKYSLLFYEYMLFFLVLNNFHQILLVSLIKPNEAARPLLDVVGGLILSSNNPLYFHAIILYLLSIILK